MDFGKAFVFMFEDPDWLRKLGIGTLVVLIGTLFSPILIGLVPLLIVAGYCLDVLRNVMEGREYPLPEWEDWVGFLVRGLRLAGVLIVWALPLIIGAIPMGIGSALLDNRSGGAQAVGVLLLICGSCLALLWGLFLFLLSPAIYARLARTGRFVAAFDLVKLWDFTRANLGNVIVAVLLTWVADLIAAIGGSLLGVIAVVIGLLVTIPFATLWSYLVQAHLYGQVARQSEVPVE